MYVLGLDVGGTSSRALLLDASGRRIGYGRAPGGNPAAHGTGTAAANIRQALEPALLGVDPAEVVGAVVGMAGVGALDRAVFDRMWASAGLRCVPAVTGDLGVAFAAGTAEPRGTVLIAGTGAIAARIEDGEPVAVSDGLGWLLGDQGSGFWLGREAARAAVRGLSRGESDGLLTRLVAEEIRDSDGRDGPDGRGVQDSRDGHDVRDGRDVQDGRDGRDGRAAGWPPVDGRAEAIRLVVHAQGHSPLELARLAPLVSRAAAAGDPDALKIVATAAGLLCATVAEVRQEGEDTPIVLAGSVLTSEGPVCSAVRDGLGAPTALAGDGAAAAAWLAAKEAFGLDREAAARLHRRILREA
ncbi:N-acetylglucosamine kinase [Streptosporangium roseum]|uniref:N-acetylglucosamine kinase-like protein n=1 Tax=Streptosporangium roseum (strain ATCC 12428 / DSM 43021 / JCM 3005 / KCTC 9067 / NCIMB 10171 / NRRL 2505 / NI 9100) TaxID=479432 RepID=D2AUL3_STRRD|nr:BadF/BadG/BcrA/BcrD ATPase family protein [Streptosporangium roseum]ACZ84875.1 N-acetylglucosamine kinase-like protein [Streptosporangium roseum DSM 43021]